MKRSTTTNADPNPAMPRGETDFEERRIECEFTLLYTNVSKLNFATFKDASEYLFRYGYFTGKAAGKRESLGSFITETLNTSPQNASVRETAGATKENEDGTTKSD